MSFGVYVHVPYCLQRCVYCDFATYEKSQILPPDDYCRLVGLEIEAKAHLVKPRTLSTLYFGGGTPSLLSHFQLGRIIKTLSEYGFKTTPETEITIEINPATVTDESLDGLLSVGFNRFSIGAQTFNDDLLKMAHRKHTAAQTRETLGLFSKLGLNFSADLLFALPHQTVDALRFDLEEMLSFSPRHVSPYCLTVPESNPMAQNRPHDERQVEMFQIIDENLTRSGFLQYEISNYARPGYESRHNQLYWNDGEYWGIGLSSHSYLHHNSWGERFWNPRGIQDYQKQIESLETPSSRLWEPPYGEVLSFSDARFDFLHTSLRTRHGISLEKFERKFGQPVTEFVKPATWNRLSDLGLVEQENSALFLTPKGRLLSNQVFEALVASKS